MSAPVPQEAFQEARLTQHINGNSYSICCPACAERFTIGRFYRAKWDFRDVAELKAMRERGLSFGQIAHKMGRSRNSIASKCRTLGLGA